MRFSLVFGMLAMASMDLLRGQYERAFGTEPRQAAHALLLLASLLLLVWLTFPDWD